LTRNSSANRSTADELSTCSRELKCQNTILALASSEYPDSLMDKFIISWVSRYPTNFHFQTNITRLCPVESSHVTIVPSERSIAITDFQIVQSCNSDQVHIRSRATRAHGKSFTSYRVLHLIVLRNSHYEFNASQARARAISEGSAC